MSITLNYDTRHTYQQPCMCLTLVECTSEKRTAFSTIFLRLSTNKTNKNSAIFLTYVKTFLGFLAGDRMSNRKEIDFALNFSNINNERISNCDVPV